MSGSPNCGDRVLVCCDSHSTSVRIEYISMINTTSKARMRTMCNTKKLKSKRIDFGKIGGAEHEYEIYFFYHVRFFSILHFNLKTQA